MYSSPSLMIVIIFKSVNALRADVYSHTTSRVGVEPGSRLFKAVSGCCR